MLSSQDPLDQPITSVIAEREETDALFESIGFRISQVRDASPWQAFRYRFPWLLATIASGTI